VDPSTNQATCQFVQSTLQQLFGSSGLTLNGCSFGECVRQNVIDAASSNSTSTDTTQKSTLGGGVIAGLAVVGSLLLIALLFLVIGLWSQRKARLQGYSRLGGGGVAVEWKDVSYIVPGSDGWTRNRKNVSDDKVILDNVSGLVLPGQMMAILGPSGIKLSFIVVPSFLKGNS